MGLVLDFVDYSNKINSNLASQLVITRLKHKYNDIKSSFNDGDQSTFSFFGNNFLTVILYYQQF